MSKRLERANALIDRRRFALAERELKEELAADPASTDAHASLAFALNEQQGFEEALQHVRTAISYAPNEAYHHYVHSVVLANLDRYDDACCAIREAIQLETRVPLYFQTLARLHLRREHWREALKAAVDGLALNAEHAGCLKAAAIALIYLSQLDRAERMIADALRVAPEDSDALRIKGMLLLVRNNPGAATAAFLDALRLNPLNVQARTGLWAAAVQPIARVGSLVGVTLMSIPVVAVLVIGSLLVGEIAYPRSKMDIDPCAPLKLRGTWVGLPTAAGMSKDRLVCGLDRGEFHLSGRTIPFVIGRTSWSTPRSCVLALRLSLPGTTAGQMTNVEETISVTLHDDSRLAVSAQGHLPKDMLFMEAEKVSAEICSLRKPKPPAPPAPGSFEELQAELARRAREDPVYRSQVREYQELERRRHRSKGKDRP